MVKQLPSKDNKSNRKYQNAFQDKRTSIIIKFREFFASEGRPIPKEIKKRFLEEVLTPKERDYLQIVKMPEVNS